MLTNTTNWWEVAASSNIRRRIPMQGDGLSTNVYAHNLPFTWTKDDLSRFFSKYGTVISSKVLFDNATLQSRGVGFVRFSRHDHATQSISALNGTIPPGGDKPLVVKFAKAQQQPQNSYGPIASSTTSNLASPYNNKPVDPSNISTSFVGPAAPKWLAQTASSGTQMLENPSTYKPHPLSSSNRNNDKDPTNLYITDIPNDYTEANITEMCSKFGTVVSSAILTDHNTGVSRGIAFCRFTTAEMASKAVKALNGSIPAGSDKPINVSLSKDTTSRRTQQDPTSVLAAQTGGMSALALGPQMMPTYPMYSYGYPTMPSTFPGTYPSIPPISLAMYAQTPEQLLQQQLLQQQQLILQQAQQPSLLTAAMAAYQAQQTVPQQTVPQPLLLDEGTKPKSLFSESTIANHDAELSNVNSIRSNKFA